MPFGLRLKFIKSFLSYQYVLLGYENQYNFDCSWVWYIHIPIYLYKWKTTFSYSSFTILSWALSALLESTNSIYLYIYIIYIYIYQSVGNRPQPTLHSSIFLTAPARIEGLGAVAAFYVSLFWPRCPIISMDVSCHSRKGLNCEAEEVKIGQYPRSPTSLREVHGKSSEIPVCWFPIGPLGYCLQ